MERLMTTEAPVFAVPTDLEVDEENVAATKRRLVDAGVEWCTAAYVDVHGIPKAKITPIDHFEEMCAGGELFTVGAVEGMGLVGPQEDECAIVPDLDTAIVLPWDRTQAWMTGDLYHHGELYPHSARNILKRVVVRAKKLGLTFNLGIEPELYVYRRQPDGSIHPITRTTFRGGNACYDLKLARESTDFLRPMVKCIQELGWGLASFDQECGRGQYEFDFSYTDVVAMCDRLIVLRQMADAIAAELPGDCFATFMPKPFADDFRSGAHFNMSMADDTGRNVFAPVADNGEMNRLRQKHGVNLSETAYHFIAGLLRHAGAITAMTCPTFNSYQGLVARGELTEFSWAPVLVTYGNNNRSAMIRVPGNRCCVENRAVDMSVNPYLGAAISLAAGLDGIENKLDPGPPLNDDLYKLTRKTLSARGVDTLPPTLLHAIEAFEADPLTEATFGGFKAIYVEQKRREWEREFYRISAAEREERLTFI
jgi:glutamine synthetase